MPMRNPKELVIIRPELAETEIQGVKIRYPKGKIVKPSAHMQRIVSLLTDPKDWRLHTRRAQVEGWDYAMELAQALEFYMGGAEIRHLGNNMYEVGSLGYYHYS